MLAPQSPDSKSVPILPAVAAMTALQMLTSAAMVAPGVMAPRIGIDAPLLGLYATAACVVGGMTAFIGGIRFHHPLAGLIIIAKSYYPPMCY